MTERQRIRELASVVLDDRFEGRYDDAMQMSLVAALAAAIQQWLMKWDEEHS